MKTFFSFFIVALFSVFLISCEDRNEVVQDNDTYSVVYDIKNVNFAFDANNGYTITRTFNNPLFDSDVMLIYRQNGTTNNGSPVWQQIPKTIYLNNGEELDYDFDFSKFDFMIYAGGTYDLATTPQYINNQTFRVVIVPASFGKSNVDLSDYNAVIKHFKIDDSKVINL